jgi:phosphoribosyl 1,2-cyclic phosphodiesterase
MKFSVLSSGSKANVTVVDYGTTRILIDCGLSARRLEERLRECGVEPESIQGILITHEHSDHVLGLSVFSRRYRVPVFISDLTYDAYREANRNHKLFHRERIGTRSPEPVRGFEVGEFRVDAFRISHDAADPVAFELSAGGTALCHCTDLGRVTPLVESYVARADALVIESNHDDEMLAQCDYPLELKERIRSNYGHLSNHAAGALIAPHQRLQSVVLAHLSEHSNCPQVALDTVQHYLPDTSHLRDSERLRCGSVHYATPWVSISSEGDLSRKVA